MARVAGQVKSGFWWFFGFICAFFFGGAAAFSDMAVPKYGAPADPLGPPKPVRPRPPKPPAQKPPTVEEKKQAEELVAKFLAPVEPTEPSAGQAADVERWLGEMRAAGEAASFDESKIKQAASELVRIGTGALGALRKEGLNSDSRVAGYCRDAARQVEAAAREATAGELLKKPGAALPAINQKQADLRAAADAARAAEAEARTAGDEAAISKASAELAAANDALALLTPLATRVTAAMASPPVRPRPPVTAKYGVKPRPRPAPPPIQGEARYGIRAPAR